MIFWFIKLRKENADLRRENRDLREECEQLRLDVEFAARRWKGALNRSKQGKHPTGIFFGAIELRHGVPFRWHPNELLSMSAKEQYETNIRNGHDMPPPRA